MHNVCSISYGAKMNNSKCYIIECTTGCSCCRNENHYRGPYATREIAQEAEKCFHNIRLLSSQYSSSGNYYIREHDCEILPDNRIIIGTLIRPRFMTEEDFGSFEEEISQEL